MKLESTSWIHDDLYETAAVKFSSLHSIPPEVKRRSIKIVLNAVYKSENI